MPMAVAIMSTDLGFSMTQQDFVADIVARDEMLNEWRLVLVEEGPWDDTTRELLRLQDRLYNSLDAILDGELAAKYPETKHARIVIQVDCFGVPEKEVSAFFGRFSEGVLRIGDYKEACEQTDYACGIGFAINFGCLH